MSKHKTHRNSRFWHIAFDTIIVLFVLGCISSGIFLLWASSLTLPSFDSLNDRKVDLATKIYDKTGTVLLYDVFHDSKRSTVSIDNISPFVQNATVAIEDDQFYQHNGIRVLSFLRAVLVNLVQGRFSQGGSTITQQVIKNSLLTKDKTPARKLKEWILALKLDKEYSKQQILEMYLNENPYGGNIYGIDEASMAYFGVHANDVTLTQAAYLAALPQAPTYYSPYGQHIDQLEARKNLVLQRMKDLGYINQEQYDTAKAEQVTFNPKIYTGIKAPHFVFFVIDQLEKMYGQGVIETGGLKVITTLDYDMQQKAEDTVLKYALSNKEKFDAENAALVAIDPRDGSIRSMVGSRDYFDTDIDGKFNVATSHRQPGSTFKPFAYAAAFQKGYTPDTVLFDVKTEFSTLCTPAGTPTASEVDPDTCYEPVNYDDQYRGPITMRNALAQSINVPAIKTLYLAGIQKTADLAKAMGITSLTNVTDYGLTLVLGGGEVSLLDMTSAYGVFSQEGTRHPYNSIAEIRNSNDEVVYTAPQYSTRALDAETARKISSILSDDKARQPAYGTYSKLYFPGRDVAVKTGTTNDYRDAWILGYTPSIAVGAWAGNNDNRPMDKKVAGQIIAPLWNEFMNKILPTIPNESFTPPQDESNDYSLKPVLRGEWQGGDSVLLDSVSGKLATNETPKETLTEILAGGIHSILYWVDKDNPRQIITGHDSADSQFQYWEYGVRRWMEEHNITDPIVPSIPTESDPVHTEATKPHISFALPADSISLNTPFTIQLTYQGAYPFKKASVYLNNELVGELTSAAQTLNINPTTNKTISQSNTLRAIVYDSVYNKTETEKTLTLSQ